MFVKEKMYDFNLQVKIFNFLLEDTNFSLYQSKIRYFQSLVLVFSCYCQMEESYTSLFGGL